MNVLLRCSTGEGYNTIMSDLGVQPPYCVASGLLSNCGSAWKASLFFIVFYYMQAFILMNLLIAVILGMFFFFFFCFFLFFEKIPKKICS